MPDLVRPDLERIKALFESRKPAHSLPQALYNDPDVFDFDMEAIYARSWLLVGFEVELPKPGSYLALTLGKWPIVVVRDRAGKLGGFHNACRHRGAQLCPDGHGSSARLVCPYHRWTYEMTGELVHAARMGEDFDLSSHGLAPIHVESVGGALYVCLAQTPPSIEDFRQKFEPLIAPHHVENAKVAFESTLVEKANWKLVMENGRECYHCAGQHPELSASFPISANAYFDFGEDRRVETYNARMAAAGLPMGPVEGEWWEAIRFPLNDGFRSMTIDGQHVVNKLMCEAGEGDIGSLRWAIEPHSFCHATSDHLFMFSALPIGPSETLVVAKWLVHKDAVEGVDYDVEKLAELWTKTNLQDRELAENNQRGVNSLGYIPGPYSQEAETLVMNFVDWYCARATGYIDAERAKAKALEPARIRAVAEG
jgi:Rieske 2Fe-2S family protein